MRVALCVIILFLSRITEGLEVMMPGWSPLLCGIAGASLYYDYFKSKKGGKK